MAFCNSDYSWSSSCNVGNAGASANLATGQLKTYAYGVASNYGAGSAKAVLADSITFNGPGAGVVPIRLTINGVIGADAAGASNGFGGWLVDHYDPFVVSASLTLSRAGEPDANAIAMASVFLDSGWLSLGEQAQVPTIVETAGGSVFIQGRGTSAGPNAVYSNLSNAPGGRLPVLGGGYGVPISITLTTNVFAAPGWTYALTADLWSVGNGDGGMVFSWFDQTASLSINTPAGVSFSSGSGMLLSQAPTAVPIPASAWLLSGAVGILAWLRRRLASAQNTGRQLGPVNTT
ncbi:MAG: hypothetical protein QY320_10825 [Gammaproteobacteria bacterium]|nr:MAG: hypothetical protein QY320_10825 [Gammaproteobacteria bacterium]